MEQVFPDQTIPSLHLGKAGGSEAGDRVEVTFPRVPKVAHIQGSSPRLCCLLAKAWGLITHLGLRGEGLGCTCQESPRTPLGSLQARWHHWGQESQAVFLWGPPPGHSLFSWGPLHMCSTSTGHSSGEIPGWSPGMALSWANTLFLTISGGESSHACQQTWPPSCCLSIHPSCTPLPFTEPHSQASSLLTLTHPRPFEHALPSCCCWCAMSLLRGTPSHLLPFPHSSPFPWLCSAPGCCFCVYLPYS